MHLYHGSNQEITAIDLRQCKPFKDFGRGFYLTTLEEQAIQMARRTTRILQDKGTVLLSQQASES